MYVTITMTSKSLDPLTGVVVQVLLQKQISLRNVLTVLNHSNEKGAYIIHGIIFQVLVMVISGKLKTVYIRFLQL